jgi:hypothetical protein
MNNELASSVLNYFKSFYNEKFKAHVDSFVNQLEIANKIIEVNDCTSDTEKSIEIISNSKKSNNQGFKQSIDLAIEFYILRRMYIALYFQLNWLLNYEA